jgi:hypothetical protein
MNLREIRLGYMDGMDLAQERDEWQASVNTVTSLQVP